MSLRWTDPLVEAASTFSGHGDNTRRLSMERVIRSIAVPYFLSFFVLFVTQADTYLARIGVLPVKAAIFFLAFAAPLAYSSAVRLMRSRDDLFLAIMRSRRIVLILAPFIGIVFLTLVHSLLPGANWSQNGRFIFHATFDFVVMILSFLIFLDLRLRCYARVALSASLALYVASILVDVLHPGTFSHMTTRAAGFAVAPNRGAWIVVLTTAAVLDYSKFSWPNLIALLVAAAGIVATLSRGGVLLLFAVVTGYAFFFSLGGVPHVVHRQHLVRLSRGGAILITVAVTVAGFLAFAQFAPGTSDAPAAQRRIEMFSDAELFFSQVSERVWAARESFDLIRESPLTGYGTGFSQTLERPPHNMYLELWLNTGPLALGFFVAMLVGLSAASWSYDLPSGAIISVLIALNSLASDSLINDRSTLIILGLLLAEIVSAGRVSNRSETLRIANRPSV